MAENFEAEKRKRGRPKVDTSFSEQYFFNSRRHTLNKKYMFDGVGFLMDAGDAVPDSKLIYFLDKENQRCIQKDGVLEQLGRMYVQDGANINDCIVIANYAVAAIKRGAKNKAVDLAIRKVRMAMKRCPPTADDESIGDIEQAVYELAHLG